jgi:outer membrane protein OmpA-like peptidoglycan-associated protein
MKQIIFTSFLLLFSLLAEAQSGKVHHHQHPYKGIVYQRLNNCTNMAAYRKPAKASTHHPSGHKTHESITGITTAPAVYTHPAQTTVPAPENTTEKADIKNTPQSQETATASIQNKESNPIPKDTLTQPTKEQEVTSSGFDNLKKPTIEKPLELAPINFVFNQDELAVANMESFIQAVEYAQNGYLVLIEGHTDDKGNNDYNLKLSMKRVQRIKQLMIDMGVNEDLISVVGHGETQPIVSNDTEANRLINRRIEFKVFKIN